MSSDRPTPDSLPKEPLARLRAVMAWLRDRQHGCPWDIDQTFRTIAPYTIEEAYEVADAQTISWEARKAAERAAKQDGKAPTGALDGVARALPALMRAEKIQKRAARVGFDWAATGPVIDKIEEELGELRAELEAGKVDHERLTGELGDVLFAVANLARHCKVDPEVALRATNDKFEKRFRYIERQLGEQGRKPADATLEEMEALWQEAKTKA